MTRRTEPAYRADEYWSRRLGDDFSLRATGQAQYSAGYNAWLYRRKGHALHRALRASGSSSGRALDIGSGTGWVIRELLRTRIDEVEGSDITAVAVERLRSEFPGVRFHRITFGRDRFPHEDASFDLVTALDVVYHVVDDADWREGLREVGRIVRPGGHVIISDGLGFDNSEPAPHVRFRSLPAWQTEAARVGLVVTSCFPLYRWLSRDRGQRGWSKVPDAVRGPVEFCLETLLPVKPHMRIAVLARPAGQP